MASVFDVVLYVLMSLFILGLIFMIGVFIVGANLVPIVDGLNPNNTKGISATQYQNMESRMWTGLTWFFYIILAVPFLYLFFKLLYEKEATAYSSNNGG